VCPESGSVVLWILYREMYSGFCVWRHSTVYSESGDLLLIIIGCCSAPFESSHHILLP
jgi:hypothetical protein